MAPVFETKFEDWGLYGKATKSEAIIQFEAHSDSEVPAIPEKLFSTILSLLRHNKPQNMGPRSEFWIPFMRLHSHLVLMKGDIEAGQLWQSLRSKYHVHKQKWFLEFATTKIDNNELAWIRADPDLNKQTVEPDGKGVEDEVWYTDTKG